MTVNYRQLSKKMSHALRHAPERYGLTLDEHGWVAIDDLLAALRSRRAAWRDLTRADIEQMMAAADKQRYAIDGDNIRAQYGHSVKQKIIKQPQTPPDVLYHGTSPKSLDAIMREGLRPMRRQYVHLSADRETAEIVGRRHHAKPSILVVDAPRAHAAGVTFYREENGIWLSEPVPADFLTKLN